MISIFVYVHFKNTQTALIKTHLHMGQIWTNRASDKKNYKHFLSTINVGMWLVKYKTSIYVLEGKTNIYNVAKLLHL